MASETTVLRVIVVRVTGTRARIGAAAVATTTADTVTGITVTGDTVTRDPATRAMLTGAAEATGHGPETGGPGSGTDAPRVRAERAGVPLAATAVRPERAGARADRSFRDARALRETIGIQDRGGISDELAGPGKPPHPSRDVAFHG